MSVAISDRVGFTFCVACSGFYVEGVRIEDVFEAPPGRWCACRRIQPRRVRRTYEPSVHRDAIDAILLERALDGAILETDVRRELLTRGLILAPQPGERRTRLTDSGRALVDRQRRRW